MAGKTTLIRSLQNIDSKEKDLDDRTYVIDVSNATIEFAKEVVFYDFAGHPLFHKMHGLFFPESTTAFLLVVDLTKSDVELQTSSYYFCSFMKCSVGFTKLKKAYVIVIGSRKDMLQNLESGKIKLRQLVATLQLAFGRWFNFHEHFVLNCCERGSQSLDLLKQAIGNVKMIAMKVLIYYLMFKTSVLVLSSKIGVILAITWCILYI